MKTILVTGGTGFIGSHICVSLASCNYRIMVVDSNVNSSKLSLKRVRKIINKENLLSNELIFHTGDLRDEQFLRNLFSEACKQGYPIEGVIHLAGLKSVEESTENPILYWDNNLCGTINLLKIMNLFDCKTIVFSSSATIYGNSKISPLKETFEIKPCNPYGQTKASIELILDSIYKNSKDSWRIINLRYFNPIGAHESGLIGENPLNKPNNLFPYICLVANGKYKKLNIFGNNWPTHDGTGVRDYIHVMDLAEAHTSSLEFLINKKPQILNLNVGTGIGTSVLELVNTFEKVNKCKIKYNFCDKRPGDVPVLIADNKKAISMLDWQPKRNIKQMCIDGWKWSFLNPNGYEK